jgi:hypothetical protein
VSAAAGSKTLVRLALGVGILCALLFALWRSDVGGVSGTRALREALTERGRVAVERLAELPVADVQGATLLDLDVVPGLTAALAGKDAAVLVRTLEQQQIDALLLVPASAPARDQRLRAKLQRYEPIAGLLGLQLSPRFALYAPEPFEALPAAQRNALAVVARRVVGGERSPQIGSFPEALRRVHPVEVMVLLREGEQPRLWRSARGSSLARALLTASEVARERWNEREQAMGGPLDRVLPRLQVEVALLVDDGTVEVREPAFIDRVFFPVHGVGYERKGSWRYLRPDDTAELGRASAAYRKLFVDDGLPADSFDRHELRLYRLRVVPLAVSPPEPRRDDGLDAPRTPDEVVAPRDAGNKR